MHILVVDDDPVSLMIMASRLEQFGHEVAIASDGFEALQILEQSAVVSFVISDWMMPGMDGLELCRKIRTTPFRRYIYFILLTIREDKASLVEGMDAGADDFLVKPVDQEELRVRIRAGERILRLERQLDEHNQHLEQLNRHLQQAYDTIRNDLEAAARLQRALLPAPATLQGFRFEWLFLPSRFIAGDMFGYFRLTDQHVSFYQLDVAGHGIPSALLSFTLSKMLFQGEEQGLLRSRLPGEEKHCQIILQPAQVVSELNRRFEADADSMVYFTMVYGLIDTRLGQVMFTQAGHPAPIWVRRDLQQIVRPSSGGFPVAMLPDMTYETVHLTLAVGDRLILYSDGITECENAAGQVFSEQRLLNLVESYAHQPLHGLTEAVGQALRHWKGDEQFQDDISLLAIERLSSWCG